MDKLQLPCCICHNHVTISTIALPVCHGIVTITLLRYHCRQLLSLHLSCYNVAIAMATVLRPLPLPLPRCLCHNHVTIASNIIIASLPSFRYRWHCRRYKLPLPSLPILLPLNLPCRNISIAMTTSPLPLSRQRK